MLYPVFIWGGVLWASAVWPPSGGRLGLRLATLVELEGLAKVTVLEFSESACLRVRGVVPSIREPVGDGTSRMARLGATPVLSVYENQILVYA